MKKRTDPAAYVVIYGGLALIGLTLYLVYTMGADPKLMRYCGSVGLALIAGAILVHLFAEGKRRKDLGNYAMGRGMGFYAKDEIGFSNSFSKFTLMNQGRQHKIHTIIQGSFEGVPLNYFEFNYSTGHGKNSTQYHLSIVAFETRKTLPKFKLEPENIIFRFAEAMGYGDIDFESHPEFSKKYRLIGDDENATREIFNVEMLQFFESREPSYVETCENRLIVYERDFRPNAETIEDLFRNAIEIYRRIDS